ncbi:lysophospholipid acyltransferase family protein [Uliginosibacterium sp. H3]|uniref:Lysophospholipid acyltransferase family protein n=1 Tax=Uliginosibacterium silvisoli TaxID=3114758 RepID=A0ABU6JZD1_9RHOO|nr:lysophospholipid acyltransferase family protein [Uliginosibacterium sp. H3]
MDRLATLLRHAREHVLLWLGLGSLALGCIVWTVIAIPAELLLPKAVARRFGRQGVMRGFRLYLWWLELIGVARFDLSALDALRDAPPMIIAPNHPTRIDAPMVLSRLSGIVCVTKASLLDSFLMGVGARLAGYIRNDWFLGTTALSIEALAEGQHVLMFPEGTRTERGPINPLRGSVGVVAARAGVPVQTLIIETDSAFLGKGWAWLRRPDMPVHFSFRLGERLEAPHDSRQLPVLLEASFRRQLAGVHFPSACELPAATEQPCSQAVGS